jgi:hypothetical protein
MIVIHLSRLMSERTIDRMIFNYLLITFDQEDQLRKEKKKKNRTIYYTFVSNSIELIFSLRNSLE